MLSATAPSHSAHQPADRFPAPQRRVWTLSCLALVAGMAVALWAERSSYESFTGRLQAKSRIVTAGRDARIARILVEQGKTVAAGTPLLVLHDPELEARLARKRRDVTHLEAELAQARAKLTIEIAWRQKELQTEIFETKLKSAYYLKQQFSNQIDSLASGDDAADATTVSATADASEQWITSLLSENRSPDDARTQALLRRQAAINALEVSSAQVELCEERLRELAQLNSELPEKIRQSMAVDVVQGRLARAQAELASLQKQQESLTLASESPGLVGVFLKGVGDHVLAHEPIVQLLDEDQPYLVLHIPSPRIADFTPGTIVELHFPGGKKGKGRVGQIPPQTAPDSVQGEPGISLVSAQIEPTGVLWPALPFGASIEVRRKK